MLSRVILNVSGGLIYGGASPLLLKDRAAVRREWLEFQFVGSYRPLLAVSIPYVYYLQCSSKAESKFPAIISAVRP